MTNLNNMFSERLTNTFNNLLEHMSREVFNPRKDKNYLLLVEKDGEISFSTYIHDNRVFFTRTGNKTIVAWVEFPLMQEVNNNWDGVWGAKLNDTFVEIIVINKEIVATYDTNTNKYGVLKPPFDFVDSLGFIVSNNGYVVGSLQERKRGEVYHKICEDWRKL